MWARRISAQKGCVKNCGIFTYDTTKIILVLSMLVIRKGSIMPSPATDTPSLTPREESQRTRLQSVLLCKLAVHLCHASLQLQETTRQLRESSKDAWQQHERLAQCRTREWLA